MRAQSIRDLVPFVAVNVLFFLLVQTVGVSSKSVFAIQWLPAIRNLNNVVHQFLGAGSPSSSYDLSPELVRSYSEWNERRLGDLSDCFGVGICAPNQSRVVLVDARWFVEGRQGLGMSVYKHFRQMGYTTLFFKNFEEALDQYSMFPDLVKLVIHDSDAVDCYVKPNCVRGLAGIPAWKILGFELSLTLFQDIVQW